MYNEKVIDHFKNPRNQGSMENPDASAQVGNPVCGDIMKLYLKIVDNRIEDIKFETLGCVAAIANTSVLTELAKGKTLEEAKQINRDMVVAELGGLPDAKIHCSMLAIDALHNAIKEYEESHK
ncbi:MAG TPA: iron-sulfur cluster assembly scaffold protein [bacterium]|nr:iron-sulfur cluster assembly scaffold protein [bacterium]